MAKLLDGLSLEESGALALADAAQALDKADDTAAFLRALKDNHRLWTVLRNIAENRNWPVPDRRQTDFALVTSGESGISDDKVHALVEMNRRVSAELAGGDIQRIRERAYFIWESLGRPQGQALDHWLLAEMETVGQRH
ncbi:MAG: DUF2934 domain-containing protein [Magnetospirillum sp.]|nr:DUF2934 domain-containing protein [Magnetospirillum sp.]